jgi:hypothetical protein
LRAAIDTQDVVTRTVRVFATSDAGAPNYRCNFMLALTFSDGGTYTDRVKADVHRGDADSLAVTRKYGKTVSKVVLGSTKCSAF